MLFSCVICKTPTPRTSALCSVCVNRANPPVMAGDIEVTYTENLNGLYISSTKSFSKSGVTTSSISKGVTR